MLRKTCVGIALVTVVVALTAVGFHRADTQKSADRDPDFTGKVLGIWVKNPAKGGVLENVQLKRIGGELFLVGRVPEYGDKKKDYRTGKTYWFPVRDVLSIIEFKNVEEARKAYADREKPASSEPPETP